MNRSLVSLPASRRPVRSRACGHIDPGFLTTDSCTGTHSPRPASLSGRGTAKDTTRDKQISLRVCWGGRAAPLSVVMAMLWAGDSKADTFGAGANAFSIDFVTVGNGGNADDSLPGGGLYFSAHGAVEYPYRIGTLEIPFSVISKAAAGGLDGVSAGPWIDNKPATNVSWYEAAAFVNWLNTSTGHPKAYDLTWSGTAWSMNLWSSAQAWQAGGENRYRHKDARYFLPSEDEWFKAGYHQNNGVSGAYWDYATASDAVPTPATGGTLAGTAVFANATLGPTDVDNCGGPGPYGTRGQNGNVWEWTESALDGTNDTATEGRTFRGGDYAGSEFNLRASSRNGFFPDSANSLVGFRVASIAPAVPVLSFSTAGLSDGTLRLRWPMADSAGLVLEYNDDLDGPWEVVTDPPAINGSQFEVVINPGVPRRFFRLRR